MTLDEYLQSIGWDGSVDQYGRDASDLSYDIGAFGIDGGGFGVDESEAGAYFDSLIQDAAPSYGGAGPSGGLTDPSYGGAGTSGGLTDDESTGGDTGESAGPSDGAGGGDVPAGDFDYEAFRGLLKELYAEYMDPREAPAASGMTGQQANATPSSRYLSNEMRDREGVERAIDYGLPASRQPLDFTQFSGPRIRPRGVRAARNAGAFSGR